MNISDFRGVLPAFPTPLHQDGTVDRPALSALIDHMMGNGAHGVVPLGGTGEFTSLTHAQRIDALTATVAAVDGRGPVIAGVVNPGIGEAVLSACEFQKAGADAVMVIPPYYVKADQQGLIDYFRYIREKSDIPVLLYDVPARSKIVVEPETIATMIDEGLIVGMKASNTDLFHFDQTVMRTDADFAMLSGQDVLFAQQVTQGAWGGIITSAVIVPNMWVSVMEAALANDLQGALAVQRRIYPLINAIFAQENPEPLREALAMIGLPTGISLPPVPGVTNATRQRIFAALSELFEAGFLATKPVLQGEV